MFQVPLTLQPPPQAERLLSFSQRSKLAGGRSPQARAFHSANAKSLCKIKKKIYHIINTHFGEKYGKKIFMFKF